ncbi:MAG: hypothetical protein JRF54_11435 [Deltaproteobacteria bacterium]|nr:hypothetical protein [Deltaproteobacteria bacterium]
MRPRNLLAQLARSGGSLFPRGAKLHPKDIRCVTGIIVPPFEKNECDD